MLLAEGKRHLGYARLGSPGHAVCNYAVMSRQYMRKSKVPRL
jgi:hypothetical protein